MQSIFQRHQNGLEGYRHHNQATFALFSGIQHLPMVPCEVPWLDRQIRGSIKANLLIAIEDFKASGDNEHRPSKIGDNLLDWGGSKG